MVTVKKEGVYLVRGKPVETGSTHDKKSHSRTMAHTILRAHDHGSGDDALRIKFDALVSHDITYVGIIQTARASGMKEFPIPYALTNCHNSLCAVGGTINEDDHAFGLSAAKKYGGMYVPANMAVIHQFAREELARAGGMILGSDSHTRYGALGAMGVGEGGPELVKQLLGNTYDIHMPPVVLVYLEGTPPIGVGPHDAALALCRAVYESGFAKNKVLEFAGPGIRNLPMDFRLGLDVMTTETACLTSIWQTDEETRKFYIRHGRAHDYQLIAPGEGAYYDGMININLSKLKPMIALPYHPSNAYTIDEFRENAADILNGAGWLADKLEGGRLRFDQGVIAGCAGGMYQNISEAAAILAGRHLGGFPLTIYPSSVPVNLALVTFGQEAELLKSGALFKPCFCGPCFGAGDVPSNMGLSARHTTRNFPNREGSKPSEGQNAGVALMDARSIAATALMGGFLTPATEIEYQRDWTDDGGYDGSIYAGNVYNGVGRPEPTTKLKFGPNIADWPEFKPLKRDLVFEFASVLNDPVTTTDELIPSGETSSYRSNPIRLSEFALSRRDPEYVARSKAIRDLPEEEDTTVGSAIWANCPGDGSAREQAASCQRVLGGIANVAVSYATKRYRSNLINWGIVPFTAPKFEARVGDRVRVPDFREKLLNGDTEFPAQINGRDITLSLDCLSDAERLIIARGCLINDYAARNEGK